MATPGFDGTPAGAGWAWVLAYGILSVILGVLAFAQPFAATFAATVVIGWFFVIAGALSLGAGLFGKAYEGRGYAIGFGLVSLLIGLVMLFDPLSAALSLTLVVAIWLGMRGVLEIVLGARMRRGKGLMIVLGVVNVLLALLVLWSLPFSALTLPGYILGVSFLLGGVPAILGGLAHRRGASAFTAPAA